MEKLLKYFTALLFIMSMHGAVYANIIGVLTESSAIGTFRDDVDGNPIIASYSGAQINEAFGSSDFGSAAIFDTTSRVGVGVVEFQNGNASYGRQVQSTSRTVVDISFENTSNTSVQPTLNSQITAAGLGIYVSGCSANDLRTCELRDDGDYDWQDVGRVDSVPGSAVVGTHFDFKVVSGEDILFQLSGGLSLLIGENGNPNTIVEDFADIESFLTNFRRTSPDGSVQQISYDWGATDFLVEFPESLMLAPGEIGNLTYITEVTTFSNAFCYDTGRQACPIAYGAFGDPIGRGGEAGPRNLSRLVAAQSSSGSPISGINSGLYQFNLPTFENGEIGFRAISGPGIVPVESVPEPNHLILMMFGMACLVMWRKRQLK
jgi:hypothetical protein